MRLGVVVVALGACSTPATPQPTPPRVAVHDAGAIDASITAPDSDDPPSDYSYRFDWQQLRDAYEVVRKSATAANQCDFRAPNLKPTPRCRGPHEVAGWVTRSGLGHKPGTIGLVIDRGARDMITLDWTVALLDEQGRPITPWAPIDHLREDSESYAELEATLAQARQNPRVGMRIDQQLQDAKLKQNPGHFQ